MWTIALTHVHWPWRLFLNSTASPHALKGSWLILSKAEVRSFRKMKKKSGLTTESSQRHLYFFFEVSTLWLLPYVFICNNCGCDSAFSLHWGALRVNLWRMHLQKNTTISQVTISPSTRWLAGCIYRWGFALFSVGLMGPTQMNPGGKGWGPLQGCC